MLDIQYIRDNKELVEEKSKQKGYSVDINELIKVDENRRSKLVEVENLRGERNNLAAQSKNAKPSEEQIEKGKQLKEKISTIETELNNIEVKFLELVKQVPNMPADDVPVGASEDDNVESKVVGNKPVFDFEPKSHWQIAEARDLIDKERAAKVTGSRFAYIKGGLVKLQLAIIQFTIDSLSDEATLSKIAKDAGLDVSTSPFVPVLPPAMIKTEVYDAMDRLQPSEDRYKIEGDELWLQGSAEHTLGSMYMGEILDRASLPIRYLGFLTSFRQEAGTYGKDTEGIIRMHQFDKLEMECFTTAEQGMNEHLFLVAIQEYLTSQLGLYYHVLQKCSADIGKPNARGIDIEVWFPSQNKFRETHTADYMTDYQARRLNTRYKNEEGKTQFIHTNDATAFALGRTMAAIIENYQNADYSISVPGVLQKYMGGVQKI